MKSSKTINVSYLISLIIHALIGAILAFLGCLSSRMQINEFHDFTEMDFAVSTPSRQYPTASDNLAMPPLTTPEATVPEQTRQEKIIELPRRRMLEKSVTELPVPDTQKLMPETKRLPARNQTVPKINGEKNDVFDAIDEVKETADAGAIPLDENEIEAVEPGSHSGKDNLHFSIEGEAAARKVLYKVIPVYPEGLATQAVIKLRFSVLPGGLVGDAMPVIKGNPTLEKISLDAFKKWRFNSLPPDEPQRIESGEITFRYLLK
ncbi:hypothetical protein JXJ21_17270 [candidate division KSB1 bacterium]|nr:hypothetical protein [candidate division KSB1 bacterium]